MGPRRIRLSVATIARERARIGLTGFGGPPVHVALLRELVVARRQWIDETAFEDANAACGLLPGPASTQLSTTLAYRLAGPMGAIVGGLGFILPAVILVLLSSVFGPAQRAAVLAARRGRRRGGAAVAAVAVRAGWALVAPSRARAALAARATQQRWGELRWALYVLAGRRRRPWPVPTLVSSCCSPAGWPSW